MATKSLSRALLTQVLSVYFVLTAFVTAVQIGGEYYDSKSVLLEELRNQQSSFRSSIARSLWEYRYDQVEEFAQSLVAIPSISGVRVRDDKGTVVVQLGDISSVSQLDSLTNDADEIPEQGGIFGYHSPLAFEFSGESTRVGDVSLFTNRAVIIERLKVSLAFIIGNALVKSTFLLLLFTLAFNQMLRKPLRELTNQIRSFRLDALEQSRIQLHDRTNTEFSMVQNAYNQLLDNLADYQADLALSEEKYREANRQLDSQNALLQEQVARKTASLSRVLVDLERRKDELETRQEKLLREIKQRKEIEQDLREANERLQSSVHLLEQTQSRLLGSEKMASLGDLVPGITHEVNNPISVSITAASLVGEKTAEIETALAEKQLTAAQLKGYLSVCGDAARMIEESLNRASDLIASFKQIAFDQGSETVREFELKPYVQSILNTVRARHKHVNIKFQFSCPEQLFIRGPAGAYTQILTNLIDNAVLHGFDGKTSGVIELTITRHQNELHIVFADDGKGLDETALEQLFTLYYTSKPGQGGTGVGMNVVFNLVTEKLAGQIVPSSQPGEGLRYDITIPAEFITPSA